MSCNSIKDGTGAGYLAKVDKRGKLRVKSVSESIEHFTNHILGQAYSVSFEVTPTGAGDCFFYFKNTSPTQSMVVEGVCIHAASNEAVEVYLRDQGTPSGGTSLDATNLNTASNNVLDATIQTGSDITGLTQGNRAYRYYKPGNNETKRFNFEQDIIISPQQTFTLYAVTGAIELSVCIDVHVLDNGDTE